MPAKKRVKTSTESDTSKTFERMHIEYDGTRPAQRNTPATSLAEIQPKKLVDREKRRQEARHTEGGVRNGAIRRTLHLIETAIANKRVLNFSLLDFMAEKKKGNVPIENGGPFKGLEGDALEISQSEGPLVLVDENDVVLFWYFPGYLGKGLQELLLDKVSALISVYPPQCGNTTAHDRRFKESDASVNNVGEGVRMTRSATAKAEALKQVAASSLDRLKQDLKNAWNEGDDDVDSDEEEEEESVDEALTGPPEPYVDMEGEVGWAGKRDIDPTNEPSPSDISQSEEEKIPRKIHSELDRTVVPPAAYYISPGWYHTGMEYKKPMTMSRQFREALKPSSSQQMIELLEAKRLFDYDISFLTDIIHETLGRTMREVRTCMTKIGGSTGVALENGWTSCFPCNAIGINMTTSIHRDTKGLNGGMDVIGLCGAFDSKGGRLKLQDLNVLFEWQPGCLAAFDGYNLAHEVLKWESGYRVTFISFCRSSTWRGLEIDPKLTAPALPQVKKNLGAAKEARKAIIDALQAARAEEKAMRAAEKAWIRSLEDSEFSEDDDDEEDREKERDEAMFEGWW